MQNTLKTLLNYLGFSLSIYREKMNLKMNFRQYQILHNNFSNLIENFPFLLTFLFLDFFFSLKLVFNDNLTAAGQLNCEF